MNPPSIYSLGGGSKINWGKYPSLVDGCVKVKSKTRSLSEIISKQSESSKCETQTLMFYPNFVGDPSHNK